MNIEYSKRFLQLLTGCENSTVTFQVFYDPKNGAKRHDLAKTWTATLDDSIEFINSRQKDYCGVYVCVNETDGQGRENSNIVKYRAFLADFDGMEEPQWPIAPHFVTKRDSIHGHAYWLIDEPTITPDEWSEIQTRISIATGTDRQVFDPARVIRLVGSTHYKDPSNPQMYVVTSDNTLSIPKHYKADEITKAFKLDATQDALLNNWIAKREGIQNGIGYEDNDIYSNQFVKWISSVAPVAIEGSGTHTLIRVASYAHDRAIPLGICQNLMWEHYNQRCMPPWGDVQRTHFNEVIGRAYSGSNSAAGCKTSRAGFKALGELPPPIDGWDKNSKINDVKNFVLADVKQDLKHEIRDDEECLDCNRLSSDEASFLSGQITVKTSHYELARVFDGIKYNGCKIIRSKKIFYVYTGRNWESIDDEVIKSRLQSFYAQFKPNDTFTRGVFNVLCDLINVKDIENGTWLKDVYNLNPEYIVSFKNGIVDVSNENPVLLPHTHYYFNFASLDYDFNPAANCDVWFRFLSSIWGDDVDLKLQLQQWMGYCLTTDNLHQKFGLFMGKSRGGKGVLCEMLIKLVGMHNVASPSLSNLTRDSTKHGLSKAMVSLIPDAHNVPFNKREAVLSEFKAQTGGDPIEFHVMYKGVRNQVIKCHHNLTTNGMPEFNDPSGAFVNRMLVFPVSITFQGKEDIHLKTKLKSEIEGIAQWAIKGLLSLNNQGFFTESASGILEKREIKDDMFPLSGFVNSMCVVDTPETTELKSLYSAYRMWASLTGLKTPMTESQVAKMLYTSDLNLTKVRNGKEISFQGIKIKDDITNGVAQVNVIPFPPVTG